MCNQHLLGEHFEIHCFVGTLNQDKSVQGYLNNGLLEIHNLHKRHDELAVEMEQRGMKHKSPLPNLWFWDIKGHVDVEKSIKDLTTRCEKCRRRIHGQLREDGTVDTAQ